MSTIIPATSNTRKSSTLSTRQAQRQKTYKKSNSPLKEKEVHEDLLDNIFSKPCTLIQRLAPFLFCLVGFLIYYPILNNGFINYDDPHTIEQKIQSIHSPLQIIREFKDPFGMPVRSVVLALVKAIGGASPAYYHGASLLLHIIASILSYFLATKWFNAFSPSMPAGKRSILSLMAGLLFLIHPISVESVAWATCIKDNLMAIFSFLTMLFYHNSIMGASKRWMYRIMACITVFLAVMSKPVAIILPLLLLSYRVLNNYTIIRTRLTLSLKYHFAGITLLLGLFVAYYSSKFTSYVMHNGQDPLTTFCTLLYTLFVYGRNMAFPLWLTPRYPDVYITGIFQSPQMWIGLLGVVLLFIFAIFRFLRHKDKLVLWGAIWFFGFWGPTSNIIPISTTVADRYIYVAMFGLFVAFIHSVTVFLDSLRARYAKYIAFIALVSYFIAFGLLAHKQTLLWKNDQTLWSDSVSKYPTNWIAHNQLGDYYYRQHDMKMALYHCMLSHISNPLEEQPLRNVRLILLNEHEYQKAIEAGLKLLEISKNPLMTDYNDIGVAYTKLEDYEKGIYWFKKALEKREDYEEALKNLCSIYLHNNQLDEAYTLLKRFTESHSDDVSILREIAPLAARLEYYSDASKYYSRLIAINPTDLDSKIKLIAVAFFQKDYANVITLADLVINHDLSDDSPDKAKYYYGVIAYKVNALLSMEDYTSAIGNLSIAKAYAEHTDNIKEQQNLQNTIGEIKQKLKTNAVSKK